MNRRAKISSPKKGQEGITLVSLVVTIVILVILASVLIQVSYENVALVNTTIEATKQYTIEEYLGIIGESVEKKIIEEATLGNEVTTDAIQKEINDIGEGDMKATLKEETDTENVGDVIAETKEGYLYSAYYDENTGRQYAEYLGEGESSSIPDLYLSYSNGSITAIATANNGNSVEKIEVQKSGETLSSEEGNSITYSVSSSRNVHSKSNNRRRNIKIWICVCKTHCRRIRNTNNCSKRRR